MLKRVEVEGEVKPTERGQRGAVKSEKDRFLTGVWIKINKRTRDAE